MKLLLTSLLFLAACTTSEQKPGFYKGYETPEYKVIKSDGDFELRQYPASLVAEVTVKGPREDAIREGFKRLAAYIFGDNKGIAQPSEKIAMTSPVIQARQLPSEKGAQIAMTSPVAQAPASKAASDEWVVQFTMPREYTLKTLPAPTDPRIRITESKPKKLAVLRFSGRTPEERIAAEQSRLLALLPSHKLKATGAPGIMFYDDPFTFPWNRRNEVMVSVK